MLNNKNTIVKNLVRLGLSRDESLIYIALLEKPKSHLVISRETGVNRTKVYRLGDELEKRSLVSTVTDDSGTKLVAVDAKSLEVELVTEEELLKAKRAALRITLPLLDTLKRPSQSDKDHFEVHTYEGVAGFKQMLWHELKATGEALIFGSGEIESLVGSVRWAEKHRAMTVEAGYKVRELLNPQKKKDNFTKNQDFINSFSKRYLSADMLNIEHQIVVFNDTVATYCWRGDQKVGYEVVNRANAQMMRQIFEHYWHFAK